MKRRRRKRATGNKLSPAVLERAVSSHSAPLIEPIHADYDAPAAIRGASMVPSGNHLASPLEGNGSAGSSSTSASATSSSAMSGSAQLDASAVTRQFTSARPGDRELSLGSLGQLEFAQASIVDAAMPLQRRLASFGEPAETEQLGSGEEELRRSALQSGLVPAVAAPATGFTNGGTAAEARQLGIKSASLGTFSAGSESSAAARKGKRGATGPASSGASVGEGAVV